MRRSTVSILGLLILLGAACRGDGGTGEAPDSAPAPGGDAQVGGDVDPCALLTPEEIGGVVGATVGAGKAEVSGFPGPDCTWEWTPGFNQASVTITPLQGSSAQQWLEGNRSTFGAQGQAGLPPEKQTVFTELSGIGDAAWAEELGDGTVQQAHAAKGELTIGLTFVSDSGPPPRDGVIQLLTTATERLP